MHTRKRFAPYPLVPILLLGIAVRAHAAPPPAPWTSKNIGPRLAPGSVDVDPRGFWTIRAFNGDVSLNADGFFFVSQPLSGDGSILALLFGQEGGDPQLGKAGLMIRADDSAGAANIHFHLITGRGIGITYRPFAGQPTVNEGAGPRYGARQFPLWLRLQREGDRFTPFSSTDGFGWTQLHSPIVLPGFPKDAQFGIAAASAYDSPVAAAFGNLTVVPGQVSPTVQVCSGNGSVLLSWPAVNNATGYMVRRSAPTTPGFAADILTSSPIKEISFLDEGRTSGQPLRYLVSAVFDQGGQPAEGWTNAVTALPVPTPGNLSGCDINLESTQLRGGVVFDPATGIYKTAGAGGDISNTEDHCYFAFQLVKGDFQIDARTLDKTAKAGVMVRESLDGASRMAFVGGSPAQGVNFQFREQPGDVGAFAGRAVISNADFKPPVVLRLVRKGNTIAAFVSVDGTTFTPAGQPRTFDPPLPESLYVGYAITSQNAGVTGTNTFRDLAIGPAP